MEFKCSGCEYKSDKKINAQNHINNKKKCAEGTLFVIENKIDIKCEDCGKQFTLSANLVRHKKISCKVKLEIESKLEMESMHHEIKFLRSQANEIKFLRNQVNELIKLSDVGSNTNRLSNELKLPDIDSNTDKLTNEHALERAKILKKHIIDKYFKHISHSEKPKYPNINLDQVIKYIVDKFKSPNIVDEFEQLNMDVQHSIPKNENYNEQKQGLYIGYLFLKTEANNEKKKIPASVRHKLWTNHYSSMTGPCTVCSSIIDNANFHAGHIISTYNGGTDNITNLSPMCPCCNLSMGTKNMIEFKNKYF